MGGRGRWGGGGLTMLRELCGTRRALRSFHFGGVQYTGEAITDRDAPPHPPVPLLSGRLLMGHAATTGLIPQAFSCVSTGHCVPDQQPLRVVLAVIGRQRNVRTVQPGAGIMEADDRQVTTVFIVQPSFHHRHSTNRVSRSVTVVGEHAVTPHLVVRRRW